MQLHPYDREAAVLYAHQWAYGRNPFFTIMSIWEGTAQTLRPSASTPEAA
mgnify:CR=1 FL=1